MIFRQAWNRFSERWQSFGLVGLNVILMGFVTVVLMIVVGLITMGGSIMSLAAMSEEFANPSPAAVLGLISGFLGFFVIAMVVGIIIYGFMGAGLVGTLAAIHRGEEVTFGTFWQMAGRYWGRVTLLALLLGLIGILVGIVGLVLNFIPIIGTLAAMLLNMIISINLGIYPTYLIVRENMGVTEALGHGFRSITSGFGEAALGALMLLALSLLVIPVGLIGMIPVLGWAVMLAFYIFWVPFLTYYYIERFETNVRPNLSL